MLDEVGSDSYCLSKFKNIGCELEAWGEWLNNNESNRFTV
jgi:hypothetical protein